MGWDIPPADITGAWKVSSVPAVSTAPSASQAIAGANLRNVLTGFNLMLSAIAAQTIIYFTIRDGATGAGTILFQWPVVLALGAVFSLSGSGMYIPGSINTAFTCELTNEAGVVTAPVATNFAAILIQGGVDAQF